MISMVKLNSNYTAIASILAMSAFLAGCVGEQVDQRPSVTQQTVVIPLPEPSSPPKSVQAPDEVESVEPEPEEAVEESAEETPQKSAWEWVSNAEILDITRNSNLIRATDVLLRKGRLDQAVSILDLIIPEQLEDLEKIEYELLQIRIRQVRSHHKTAFRMLGGLLSNPLLSPEQRLRIFKLRVHSASFLDNRISVVNELVRLYSYLPPGSERLAVGHQLWDVLATIPSDELADALAGAGASDARPWILLALNVNQVRHDPQLVNAALQSWIISYPDHPAVQFIGAGIAAEYPRYSKVAVLLPLSSPIRRAANTFRAGLESQYFSDTTENKPIIEFVDIGDDPNRVTQYYHQALVSGADFIVGPLGITFVDEMVQANNFIVPTLLLGVADDIPEAEDVYQFALAPEQDGVVVARRAREDGHSTAMILESPSNWSKRSTEAFRNEWEQLGGAVVHSTELQLEQGDYSETVEKIFNIDQSVERYRKISGVIGQSVKFVPRRRFDVDFIFLSTDPTHGRLIKPHIDFLKAHDVPVYSTYHVFSGRIDKISDQDLDGIRFADMNWLIDQSESMENLRSKLKADRNMSGSLRRIYAMGIDTYNLISRLSSLRGDSNEKYHGVTSILTVDENGRVVRNPKWVQFIEGTPEVILQLPDPEGVDLPVTREPSKLLEDLQR